MRRAGLILLLALLVAGIWWCRTPTPPPTPPPAAGLRLCAWNVKKLGHGSRKDYPLVADILRTECDAAVIVEVMQKGGGHPGYDALLAALGPAWRGTITNAPRPNTTAGHAEFYAVLHRQGTLTPCEGFEGLRYVEDHDGSPGDEGPDRFDREPAYGCFAWRGPGGALDFLFAAYHARWADGAKAEIAKEVAELERLVAEMRRARPGEGDIFVLGDFNLVPDDLAAVTDLADWTVGVGSTLNSRGERTENLYDHLLVASPTATPELSARAEVLDVRGRAETPKIFYRTVSDHLPIRVTLELVGPDDD